jgi:hypothetical protein
MRRLLILVTTAALAVLGVVQIAGAAKPPTSGKTKTVQFKTGSMSGAENQDGSIAVTLNPKGSTTVLFSTIGGTATPSTNDTTCDPGEDYVPRTGSPITFVNQAQLNLQPPLKICNDGVYENDETIVMQLNSPTNGYSLANGKQVINYTIKDDDPAPVITIDDASPSPVVEGNDLTFLVHLTGSSAVTTTVQYDAASGTLVPIATVGSDFPATTGTKSWGPFDTSDRTITVPTTDDNEDELTENMRVLLSNPVNGTIQDGTGAGQISDNDVPVVSIEGILDNEDGTMPFHITLDRAPAQPVVVSYVNRDDLDGATAGGSCATPDVDYLSTSGTVTFNPGDPLTKSVDVTTCIDDTPEPDEGVIVEARGATNATVDPANDKGNGTLLNDDVTISVNDPASLDEDNGTPLQFTVSLDFPSLRTVTVDVATLDGTATGGAVCQAAPGDGTIDFESISTTTITFNPGETSKTVDVTLCSDDEVEGSGQEAFTLELSNALPGASGSATIGDPSGTGLIDD